MFYVYCNALYSHWLCVARRVCLKQDKRTALLFCNGICYVLDSRNTSLFWAVGYLSNLDVLAGFGTSQACG